MEAKNDSLETVDQFDCWVGSVQLNAQIFLPSRPRGLVVLGYPGPMEGTETYVCEMSHELRCEGFGTVVVDCMPDAYRYEDYSTPLRRYLPAILRNRLAGVLGRLRDHEELDGLPIGCVGIGPCAAPAMAASETIEKGLKAVVTVGGRPGEATELVETITAPTLVLGEHARLEEDHEAEESLKEMFEGAHSEVRLLHAEPPFADPESRGRTSALATNWLRDRIAPRPAPTPDLSQPTSSPRYGLPPMPSLVPDKGGARAARA